MKFVVIYKRMNLQKIIWEVVCTITIWDQRNLSKILFPHLLRKLIPILMIYR